MQPYQWAKTRAEELAFEMGDALGLRVVSIVPTCILGPPSAPSMRSNSLDLVRGWLQGQGKVQTRLVCDVRHVAALHIAAVRYSPGDAAEHGPLAAQQRRFIVGTESRVPAHRLRNCLVQGAVLAGLDVSNIRFALHPRPCPRPELPCTRQLPTPAPFFPFA
jgi:nucleoside-diphosphate-sugar epimerase